MKRSPNRLLTDALREVRGTISRFLSLMILSTLAVAFLAGLRTTAPDMKYTADKYYDAHALMDLRVLSTLGLTQEDVAALGAQPGISMARGGYTVDALLKQTQGDLIVKALSLSAGINTPRLLQGRMPQKQNECLADPLLLESSPLTVGDTVTLDTGTGDMADALRLDTFTIVGVAESPLYISVERGSSTLGSGKVSAYLLLREEAFDLDFYTDAYLLADGMETLQCYSDDYTDEMDTLADTLAPLGDQRADGRYDEVVGEANETLEDAQREFNDAEAEVAQELADAEQALKDARRELDDGWRALADGRETLLRETADAERTIAEAEQALPDASADLEQGELDYTEGLQELEDGWADYREGEQALQDGVTEYDDGLQLLMEGEEEYNLALITLQDAEVAYRRGAAAYETGIEQLKSGAAPLVAAKSTLDDAKFQLTQGDAALDKGQQELDAANAQLTQGQQQLDMAAGAVSSLTGGAVSGDPASWTEEQKQLADQAVTETKTQVDHILNSGMPLPPEQAAALTAQSQQLGQLLDQSAQSGGVGNFLQAQDTTLKQGWSSYQAGEKELSSGASALSAGWSQYMEGWSQYVDAGRALRTGVEESQAAANDLTVARLELDDGWRQLKEGRQGLDDGWSELASAKLELDDGQTELDDALEQLLDGQAELEDARRALDDGWQKYQEGVAELADAKIRLPREIADAQKKLDDALITLEDGEAEYADGLIEYADGRQEAEEKLSDARKKLNDARREIRALEDCQWYILGRNTNIGYVSFQQDAERMGNLASVFPLIFFLVAALVCLTTMTRMVEEQRVQIGAMKAMGYSKRAISFKYIGYGFFSSLLGGLLGLALGCTLIPLIIFTAWKALYTVGELSLYPSPGTGILAVLAGVLCVTGAAVAASMATLSAVPAQLMRPKAPPIGKRVLLERFGFLWRRLSFTHKVTVRNLFRYKKRFWMTVAGIGGCTALIVTGFGLRDSIFDITGLQYDGISTYSANIGLDEDVTADELLEIGRTLDGTPAIAAWMTCHQTALTAQSDRRAMDAQLFAVNDPSHFEDFIQLRHRLDAQTVSLPQEGAVITEKLADLLGVQPGDTITLDGDRRVEVLIADTTEHYVYHYIYLSAAYYQALYGAPPATNLILADYAPDTRENAEAVASSLIALSGITTVSRIRDSRDTLSKSMESVDYAVIVVIISAAALAFVVLYNLTNINITERQRELATLKVLGFYDRELSAYVYRENVLLTVFGVLLGVVMGKYLHQWLVLTVEIDMVMFGRTANPMSYLYAVVLTLLFSALVNLAAHRRLKRIDMVESLKTVE